MLKLCNVLLCRRCSANDILGVVGADVPASLIYNFLMTEFDECRHANREYVFC